MIFVAPVESVSLLWRSEISADIPKALDVVSRPLDNESDIC
jgi:hypothetical protein